RERAIFSAKTMKPPATSTTGTARSNGIVARHRQDRRRPRWPCAARPSSASPDGSRVNPFIVAMLLPKKWRVTGKRWNSSVTVSEISINRQPRCDGCHHGNQEGDAERAEIADRSDIEPAEQGRDLVGLRDGHGRRDDEGKGSEEERGGSGPGEPALQPEH